MFINKFSRQPNFLFEKDSGGAGGSGGQGDDDPEKDANTGGDGGSGDDDKKFSQADVDRLQADRAKRAKKAAVKNLLEELGFDDVTALKTVLSEHQKAQEAQKTDLQKAQEERDSEKAAREQLEARYKRERIDRIIEREARGMEFAETAIPDVTLLIDRSEIDEDDKGQISGVKEALQSLLEAKPHMKKAAKGGDPPDIDGDKGKGSSKGKPDRSAVKRRFGI
jgi:hypothetical protein